MQMMIIVKFNMINHGYHMPSHHRTILCQNASDTLQLISPVKIRWNVLKSISILPKKLSAMNSCMRAVKQIYKLTWVSCLGKRKKRRDKRDNSSSSTSIVQTVINWHSSVPWTTLDDSCFCRWLGSFLIGRLDVNKMIFFRLLDGFFLCRFGRLRTVIIGMLCSSIFGLIKSFSVSYLMYLIVSEKKSHINR